jgi:hypothetical protein
MSGTELGVGPDMTGRWTSERQAKLQLAFRRWLEQHETEQHAFAVFCSGGSPEGTMPGFGALEELADDIVDMRDHFDLRQEWTDAVAWWWIRRMGLAPSDWPGFRKEKDA